VGMHVKIDRQPSAKERRQRGYWLDRRTG